MDGQEIALRMIQVAEAASVAAQSAAEALGRRSEGDKNWFRVLPKPANFDAKTREEELSQWGDFSWSIEQYLSSMDGAFAEDFKELRKRPGTVVDPTIQTDQERQRSTFLSIRCWLHWSSSVHLPWCDR